MATDPTSALLEQLRATPRHLTEAVRGLPRQVVAWSPAPGSWSILEVVCHMRDMEREAYLARYERMRQGDRPQLPWVDGDRLACDHDYRRQRLSEALREFRKLRKQTLALLAGFDAATWALEGVHETAGAITMHDLLERQVRGDDLVHLKQIETTLERYAILERLGAGPKECRGFLGVGFATLARRLEAARWSMLEHICHLRDYDQLMLERYSKIVSQERPKLRLLDADATAAARRYTSQDVVREVRELESVRRQCLELLHALPARLWQRRGVHPERGEKSIAELVAHHLDHEARHLSAMRKLRAALAPATARPAAPAAEVEVQPPA